MSNSNNRTTGWLAIASGISGILALLFLGMMAGIAIFFGPLNDFFNGLAGVLIGLLAWRLYEQHKARSASASRAALVFAVMGVIFAVVGSVLIMFHITGFVLAGWYTGLGYALLGIWLVMFCSSMRVSGMYPKGGMVFGIVAGAAMMTGLLSAFGILADIDTMEGLPMILNIAYLAFMGIYIFYPIWAIWFGRTLLKN